MRNQGRPHDDPTAPATTAAPTAANPKAEQETTPPLADPGARSARLYAMLLRLYPSGFRARFAHSMRYSFATEAAQARRRGALAFAAFWCRSLAHVLAYGVGERLRRLGGGDWRRGLATDTRHAARRLRRSPGFTAAAMMTLGLGIGANTAIFSLVHGVVIEPLPYPHAERLVSLQHSAEGAGLSLMGLSYGTYVHYREHGTAFEAVTVFTNTSFALLGEEGAQRVRGAMVAQDFFEIFLDGAPLVGRAFADGDQIPGAPRVAMIAEELWRSRFGADTGIVGRTIQVDGVPVVVAGVLPASFDMPSDATQVWLPQQLDPETVILGGFGRFGVARLRPGVGPEQARAELQTLIPSLADRFNPVAFDLIVTGGGLAPIVRPLKDMIVGDTAQMLWLLLGTVAFVLSVACANVANLFLVRAETQRREIAVRAALGAGRAQIVRHHLVESLVLGLFGGLLGVVLAVGVLGWVVRWGPTTIPRLHEVGIHAPVLGFALAISLGAGVAFGIIPILKQRDATVAGAIADGGRGATTGRGRHRARNALVVTQVSLALVLLVGAGLMVRTFWHLRAIEPGFDPASTLVFQVGLPEALYADREQALRFQQQVIESLAALPGVASVGATRCLPLEGCGNRTPIYAGDRAPVAGETPPSVDVRGATAGYFSTLRIALLEGRDFEQADPFRQPVAVVSRNLAERLWPGERPIGKSIHPDYPSEDPYTIVGVVENHVAELVGPPREFLYLSYLGPYAYVAPPQTMSFAVRTEVEPLSLASTVRDAVRQLDPNVPLANLRTMQDVVDEAGAPTAFAMILLVVAGGVAALLGAIGVYGVLSYVVSQRTSEIGVRMALGAQAGDVSGMILRQGTGVVAVGIGLGLAAALALTRLMDAVLFGVAPDDPATYTAVSLGLASVALAASYLPARRAARVDPVDALKG